MSSLHSKRPRGAKAQASHPLAKPNKPQSYEDYERLWEEHIAGSSTYDLGRATGHNSSTISRWLGKFLKMRAQREGD